METARAMRLPGAPDVCHSVTDIAVKFVGSDNRTYDDSCGVIPTR
jgi:hypothetical protein